MKIRALIAKILLPLFAWLEEGTGEFIYKPSYRITMIVLGMLLSGLSVAVLWMAWGQEPGYFLPVILFGGVGIYSILVAVFASDKAVSRLWRAGRGQ